MEKDPKENFEKLKAQLETLKEKINNMDRVLDAQEDALTMITENTKSLLNDLNRTDEKKSLNQIMKSVFSKGALPKILEK